jgi:hypothetical protein
MIRGIQGVVFKFKIPLFRRTPLAKGLYFTLRIPQGNFALQNYQAK